MTKVNTLRFHQLSKTKLGLSPVEVGSGEQWLDPASGGAAHGWARWARGWAR
jgi:hypothetical protein